MIALRYGQLSVGWLMVRQDGLGIREKLPEKARPFGPAVIRCRAG
jgi:hypothetical protein